MEPGTYKFKDILGEMIEFEVAIDRNVTSFERNIYSGFMETCVKSSTNYAMLLKIIPKSLVEWLQIKRAYFRIYNDNQCPAPLFDDLVIDIFKNSKTFRHFIASLEAKGIYSIQYEKLYEQVFQEFNEQSKLAANEEAAVASEK